MSGVPIHYPPLQPAYAHPYPQRHDEHFRPAFFSYSPDVIKHRRRTSRSQRKVLEDAFRQNPKPSQYTRKLLIHQTGMERRAIQVWFQNRRAKAKKDAAKAAQTANQPSTSAIAAGAGDGNGVGLDDEDEDEEDILEHDEDEVNAAMDDGGSGSDSATPSAHDASTPAETTTTTGSSNSPPSSYNAALTPPSAYRSPAHNSKGALAPDLQYSYAMRRTSAPTLSADAPRPVPYLYDAHAYAHPIAVLEANTPPSPLSVADDFVHLRRGSLPAYPAYNETHRTPFNRLPAVPADPLIRRASLERSKQRLASHPYAWQVAASNGTYVGATTGISNYRSLPHHRSGIDATMDSKGSSDVQERPQFGHANTAPAAPSFPDPTQLVQNESPSVWFHASDSQPLQPHHIANHNMATDRRNFDSPNVPLRTQSEIVPGPLPIPNFSFGTAPAPILESETVDNNDEIESGTGTLSSSDDVQRFGSFATDSSSTSAWFSDVPSFDAAPPSWDPEARRASCPAPFVSAFSGLQVSGPHHDTQGILIGGYNNIPISTSSELASALDLSVDTSKRSPPIEHASNAQFSYEPHVSSAYPPYAMNSTPTGPTVAGASTHYPYYH